jgi:hypothetical protein
MELGDLFSKLGQTWPARLAKDAVTAASFPGRVYASETPVSTEEMVGPAADIAMTLGGGAPVTAEAGAAGVFGGRLAKTGNEANRLRAVGLDLAGVPSDVVWKRTGYNKGADGSMKFEIPDQNARLKPGVVEEALHDGQNTTLGAIFEHPELYKAYPEFETMPVRPDLGDMQAYGAYDLTNPGIRIGDITARVGPDEVRSTLLHEIQHAIQHKEGFAQGSSPEIERMAMLNDLKKQYETTSDPGKQAGIRARGADLIGPPNKEALDRYYRSAGETESRNVQYRRDFTDEQRRATPPEASEALVKNAYPRDQQTVRTTRGLFQLFDR